MAFQHLRRAFALAVPVFLILVIAPQGTLAQDDLSVPGLTEETPAPGTVGEDPDEPVDTGPKTFMDRIEEGGWAMWPLGLMSAAIIALTVYCLMDLKKSNFYTPALVESLNGHMANTDLEGLITESQASPQLLGRMMAPAAIYIAEEGYTKKDNDLIRDIIAETSIKETRGRAKLINYFSVISQAAPMMGLLGTVSGMIKAFGNLAASGMGDPSKLADNISEALITTASGLIIALPAVFLYFFFRDKLDQHIATCEEHAADFLNTLRRAVGGLDTGVEAPVVEEDEGAEPVEG